MNLYSAQLPIIVRGHIYSIYLLYSDGDDDNDDDDYDDDDDDDDYDDEDDDYDVPVPVLASYHLHKLLAFGVY